MLVDPESFTSYGKSGIQNVTYTRLRYELTIKRNANKATPSSEYFTNIHEILKPIYPENDKWIERVGLIPGSYWLPALAETANERPKELYISTQPKNDLGLVTIKDHPNYLEFFAIREELRNFSFLQLNPEELRYSSSTRTALKISDDKLNLPARLGRLNNEDIYLVDDVSSDMRRLVPEIKQISYQYDQQRREPLIKVTNRDSRIFSWQTLSDGTLRMLALAILANDPNSSGTLFIEEPENGIHPATLKEVASLLRNMATDFSNEAEVGQPLRQVLVTTHSPLLISQPEVIDNLLFAYITTRLEPGKAPLRATRIDPVYSRSELHSRDLNGDKTGYYTLAQIEEYLNTVDLKQAEALLEGPTE